MNRCKICKKETKNKVYCSTKCQHEGYREKKSERIKVNCIFCGNEFEDTEYRINTIGKKYCSRSCKDTHQKELYQGEGNPVYGQEHSEEWKKWQSDRVTELWKSDEYRQKVKEGQEKFRDENGYWCGTDENSKNKRKDTLLRKYGFDHNWKVKEIRKKCELTSIKNTGLTTHERARKELLRKKETNIEKKIKDILISNKINFKKNFCISFDNNKRMFDFYLKDYNLLIEADGDYWHSNPIKFKTLNETQQKNKLNDDFKNYIAKELGYNLIRFWETDINKNEFENVFLNEIKRWKIR